MASVRSFGNRKKGKCDFSVSASTERQLSIACIQSEIPIKSVRSNNQSYDGFGSWYFHT